ncbi:putative phosphothreonine lyase domain-containing protein [Kitasatospora sp. NPDC052896]|uniref:putative phosphothreonine lyase domain-containing protein n=1 Tax=Kitasatospora sp. NPDC052896 TaxID=3364061 RepID=UPI0037C9D106
MDQELERQPHTVHLDQDRRRDPRLPGPLLPTDLRRRTLVERAVKDGKLGPGAKVATLGNVFDGDPTRRPVVIFTADCTDESDVHRVLIALRTLGINDALAYKTDEATAHGEYGDRVSLYTSPAGTTKVVRRTPRYAAPA